MGILNDRLSLKYLPNFTFIYWLTSVIKFLLIAASSHSKYFEAINFGDEARCRQHLVIEMLNKEEIVNKNDIVNEKAYL